MVRSPLASIDDDITSILSLIGEDQLHFLLEFLSLCESSGFIQLKLPLSELREQVHKTHSMYMSVG